MGCKEAVPERSSGGGECVHCIYHLLPLDHCLLLCLLFDQTGVFTLLLSVEGVCSTGQTLNLLSTTTEWRVRHIMVADVNICAQTIVSSVFP